MNLLRQSSNDNCSLAELVLAPCVLLAEGSAENFSRIEITSVLKFSNLSTFAFSSVFSKEIAERVAFNSESDASIAVKSVLGNALKSSLAKAVKSVAGVSGAFGFL